MATLSTVVRGADRSAAQSRLTVEQDRELRRLYEWSFAVRFGAGLLGWLLTLYADIPLVQDAMYYEEAGAGVAHDWLAGHESIWMQQALASGRQPWLMVGGIATLYWLTGGIRMVPVLLALYSALTAWTPLITYRIAHQLGASPRAARAAGWLLALSPGFAFWSGTLYKEGLIMLMLNLGIYHALSLQSRLQWRSLIVVLASVLSLLGLRFYLAPIMFLTVLLALLLGRTTSQKRRYAVPVPVRQTVLVGIFMAGAMLLRFDERIKQVLPADIEQGFRQAEVTRDDLARAQSGYLQQANISTPEQAFAALPMGVAYFLTVPLPWQFGALRQNLIIPETLFWTMLYPLAAIGLWKALRRNPQGALTLFAIIAAMTCFYGLYVSNAGAAYRMRTQVWLLLAVFAAWGWDTVRDRRRATRSQRPRRGRV